MPKNSYIVGLDIGTKKVAAIIGEITEDRKIEVIGIGTTSLRAAEGGGRQPGGDHVGHQEGPGRGRAHGRSRDRLRLRRHLRRSYQELQQPRGHCRIGKNREITREDIRRVIDQSKAVSIPPDRTSSTSFPRSSCGRAGWIKAPLGMSGSSSRSTSTSSPRPSPRSRTSDLCRAGRDRDRADLLNQIATASAVLTHDEKELGVGLIDIGAAHEVAIFERAASGTPRSSRSAGITSPTTSPSACGRDPEAEKIKKKFGCVSVPAVDEQETIEVPSSARPASLGPVASDPVRHHPTRAEEIFRLVDADIKRMATRNL